uniref:Uncharacterized protein n=1 Tax=Brassica oleracea var. oleracea TaxID=109376 RepID=A0A0D2ZUH1_BRAOL
MAAILTLYVVLSRVTSKAGLTIIKSEDSHQLKVKNIVYKEIFKGLPPHKGYFFLMVHNATSDHLNT